MAIPPPRSPGVLLLLGLLLGACGAGQYDVQECDPSVPNLQKDLCNPLNDAMGLSGCMLYQCDNVTRRCVLKPRDYDRDGDPDPACGGGDCEDTDPSVYPTAVELCDNKDNNCNGVKDEGCSCNPSVIGSACYDGRGACKRKGQFVCNANVPICSAMAAEPQLSWHNAVDTINSSDDWDCNGMGQLACCVDSMCAQPVIPTCPAFDCSKGDPGALCASFCAPLSFSCNSATAVYRCDNFCGGRALICRCQLTFALPACQPIGSSFSVVGCK
jgi:hypothetical protein